MGQFGTLKDSYIRAQRPRPGASLVRNYSAANYAEINQLRPGFVTKSGLEGGEERYGVIERGLCSTKPPHSPFFYRACIPFYYFHKGGQFSLTRHSEWYTRTQGIFLPISGRIHHMRKEDPKIHIKLAEEIHAKLRVKCALERKTIQGFVSGLLEQAVEDVTLPAKRGSHKRSARIETHGG